MVMSGERLTLEHLYVVVNGNDDVFGNRTNGIKSNATRVQVYIIFNGAVSSFNWVRLKKNKEMKKTMAPGVDPYIK